jgi:hypothetical protein
MGMTLLTGSAALVDCSFVYPSYGTTSASNGTLRYSDRSLRPSHRDSSSFSTIAGVKACPVVASPTGQYPRNSTGTWKLSSAACRMSGWFSMHLRRAA